MLFLLGKFTCDYNCPIWGLMKHLYMVFISSVPRTHTITQRHTLGFPFVSEVPKTSHMFGESLGRLTGLNIHLHSQLYFTTVKGYTTGSARKKDTGGVWRNHFMGFLCSHLPMSGHLSALLSLPAKGRSYMCNGSAQGSSLETQHQGFHWDWLCGHSLSGNYQNFRLPK